MPSTQQEPVVKGHKKMILWQMVDKLDIFVQEEVLSKVPKNEYKMRSQIDNASDSVDSNFMEGYYSGSLGEYIKFLKYGRRSTAELISRVRRVLRKGHIDQETYDIFEDTAIKTKYLFDRTIYSLEKKRAGN